MSGLIPELYGTTSNNPLKGKQRTQFRSLLKLMEAKQLKKCLKICDQILKASPEHGETLAMKGLVLRMLDNDKKEECYALVKEGVSKDIGSYVCWHVYAILCKADRDYQQAAKCFKFALRKAPNNTSLLKSLAEMLTQSRSIVGLVETRRTILVENGKDRSNWVAFAVANHIVRDYDQALSVLDEYIAAIKPTKFDRHVEYGEVQLYRIGLLEEMGDVEGALRELHAQEADIGDKLRWRETRGRLLVAQGDAKQAARQYRVLLRTNPDNAEYHRALRGALALLPNACGQYGREQVKQLDALYEELAAESKYATTPKIFPLVYTPADSGAFLSRFADYVQPRLRKGKPSLFRELQEVYQDDAKAAVMGSAIGKWVESLRANGCFPSRDDGGDDGVVHPNEPPSTLLYALYFAAQHQDADGNTQAAMELVDEAVAHTPTMIDLYSLRARIAKHAGDVEAAADYAEQARRMDLADRHLNCRAVKYLLRAGRVQEATEVAALFLRKDEPTQQTMADMQASWYQVERGRAFLHQDRLEDALENFDLVRKNFAAFWYSQADFHSYCCRKTTLQAYATLLRSGPTVLNGHKFAAQALAGLVRCYVRLHRRREQQKEDGKTNEDTKTRSGGGGGADGAGKRTAGQELAMVEDPLEEAAQHAIQLRRSSPNELETHQLNFLLAGLRNKPLLQLQALLHAREAHPDHPETHLMTVQFVLQSLPRDMDDAVRKVVEPEVESMQDGKTVSELRASFVAKHCPASLPHAIAAAQSALLLGESSEDAVALITADRASFTLEDAVKAHQVLEKLSSSSASAWKNTCHEMFPLSRYFISSPGEVGDLAVPDSEGEGDVVSGESEKVQKE